MTPSHCWLFFIAVLALACGSPPSSSSDQHEGPPNIIYIIADDLGYGDLSSYGQTKFATPNIDRLARQGMKFTRHYSGSTVCAPSRSCLMTGLHTGHTQVRGNKEVRPEGQEPLLDEVVTVAELLQAAGYATGAFGKWGLGAPGSEGDPVNQGFDRFYGYNCQRLAHNYYPLHLWDNDRKVELPENAGASEGLYAPDLIQEQALDFIDENKDGPFFMFVPNVIPHAELKVPEKYMAMYRDKFLPEKVYEGCDPGCARYKDGGYGSQTESHAAFAGMIHLLDEQVGQILDRLEQLNIDDRTIVFFTSDNGPHLEGGADPDYFDSNGPLRGYKRDLYEGGIRVPLLARWPGRVPAGAEANHISAFWDMLPTFLEIAEQPSPGTELDGISFLPTLTQHRTQDKHDYLYWEFHERGHKQAVVMEQWKGIRLIDREGVVAPTLLYDLSQDVGEEKNIADEHPNIVQQMEQIMAEARTPSSVENWNF